jgi:hypothetical protein
MGQDYYLILLTKSASTTIFVELAKPRVKRLIKNLSNPCSIVMLVLITASGCFIQLFQQLLQIFRKS